MIVLTLAPLLVAGAGPASAADAPPPQPMQIGTAMPPGNSGFVSVPGQAQGMATGEPGAYGEHVDDQRVMFWDGEYKDGRFKAPTGTPQTPKDGVRLYEDDKGVPVVYGDTTFDVWFGAGYAAGQQRLFLADAVRRMGRGTFAELVGPSGVPLDVQARTLTYSQADYDAMFAALPEESRQSVEGYAAGMDAWISHVRTTPTDLPAEYALLSSLPEPWTVTDTLAAGVLITRTVASAGGNEFDTVEVLRSLQDAFGDDAGLGALGDVRWTDDRAATVSVPGEDGAFDNAVVPAPQRAHVLQGSADYALALPAELATGTGDFPAPAEPGALPVPAAAAVDALNEFRANLHGGSYALAVRGGRTSTGGAMLVSCPQLGYSYPSLLWEVEVHGAGYDARGSTVPGLPTVGIGYGERVAWGLTTGNSKTIDSFIETVRRSDDDVLQYLHDGTWKDADCRTETVRYRPSLEGVPAGPPALAQDVEVCRTVHGPVVATSDDGTQARSVQYAMYGRELETVDGILAWNRADTFEQFEAGVRQTTWNENVVYADADGRIAYWHPGLFPVRSSSWDSRFPAPGTGEHDQRGMVPFERMPHSIDPAVGYLATWNNKPASGWLDEYLDPASSRPAGRGNRVQVIQSLLAAQPRLTPEALRATELKLGLIDQRAQEFLPLLRGLRSDDPGVSAALELLRAWDGVAYDRAAYPDDAAYQDESVTDDPDVTVFARFMDALREELFTDLPEQVRLSSDAVASHVWDVSVVDNLALRVLDPSTSSLTPSRDYTDGRSPEQVLLAAVADAVDALVADHGADPAAWRDQHPRREIASLTGVIGPSVTMPYQDRGSWVHVVAFDGPGAPAVMPPPTAAAPAAAPPVRAAPVRRLPATGAAAWLVWGGLALLLAGALARRRTRPVGAISLAGIQDDDLAG